MPFKKVGDDDYTGPSGKHFDKAQVRLYYANGGKFPGQQSHNAGGIVANKGAMSKDCAYAQGGEVLGRTRNFMKETDGNDQRGFGKIPDTGFVNPDKAGDTYTKPGAHDGASDLPKVRQTKTLKTVKPRS